MKVTGLNEDQRGVPLVSIEQHKLEHTTKRASKKYKNVSHLF